jgi:hypothetical protein
MGIYDLLYYEKKRKIIEVQEKKAEVDVIKAKIEEGIKSYK